MCPSTEGTVEGKGHGPLQVPHPFVLSFAPPFLLSSVYPSIHPYSNYSNCVFSTYQEPGRWVP